MNTKIFTLLLLSLFTQLFLMGQQNIAPQAKIISAKHIENPEFLIDEKKTAAKNCEYSLSSFVLDLQNVYAVDSVLVLFKSLESCDNWIKSLQISAGTESEELSTVKTFGESHFTKKLVFHSELKTRYFKFEIHSLEDCMENEYMCIQEVEIYTSE